MGDRVMRIVFFVSLFMFLPLFFSCSIAEKNSTVLRNPANQSSDWRGCGVGGKCRAFLVRSREFDAVDNFSEGLAGVSKHGKWGFINVKGEWVIEPQFEDARPFSEGFAEVETNGYFKWINTEGEFVEPPLTDRYGFSEGLVKSKKDDKWGYKNTEGEWVVEPQFEDARAFSEGFAAVKKHGKWGFIGREAFRLLRNENFEFDPSHRAYHIIPPEFDDVQSFSEGFAAVKKDDKWGYINIRGEWIIRPQLDGRKFPYPFREGLVLATIGQDKWGFMNRREEWVIEPIFDRSKSFNQGMAAVEKHGKWGFMNIRGEWIIRPQFEDIYSFGAPYVYEGVVFVRYPKDGRWSLIRLLPSGQ